MQKIRLNEIICNNPDEKGEDEIFLKYKDKKIWPLKSKFIKIGVDDQVPIGVSGKFGEGWVAIELWDYDYTSKNDFLGVFHLEVSPIPGQFGTVLTLNESVTDHADYLLNWEILAE